MPGGQWDRTAKLKDGLISVSDMMFPVVARQWIFHVLPLFKHFATGMAPHGLSDDYFIAQRGVGLSKYQNDIH
jgi:hypothetical protein